MVHDDPGTEDVIVHTDEVGKMRVDDDAQRAASPAELQGMDVEVRLLQGNEGLIQWSITASGEHSP